MASIYTYPHVNVTTKATIRRVPTPAESTATTLLAPFTCNRGPENELVKIDSFSDFVNIFGELDYSNPDQRQILNIGNWLINGGRVLACRLTDINHKSGTINAKKATVTDYYQTEYSETGNTTVVCDIDELCDKQQENKSAIIGSETIPGYEVYRFTFDAKYSGTYYNGIKVTIEPKVNNKGYYDVTISQEINGVDTTIEVYKNKSFEEIISIENSSSYIGKVLLEKAIFEEASLKNLDTHTITQASSTSPIITKLYDSSETELYYNFLNTFKSNFNTYYTGVTLLVTDNEGKTAGQEVFVYEGGEKLGANRIYYATTATKTGEGGWEGSKNVNVSILSTDSAKYAGMTLTKARSHVYSVSPKYGVNKNKLAWDIIDTPFTAEELADKSSITRFQSTMESELANGADVEENYIYGHPVTVTTTNTLGWSSNLVSDLKTILVDPLLTPFDCMIDCGYHVWIKEKLIDLFSKGYTTTTTITGIGGSQTTYTNTEKRDDAFLYLSNYFIKGNGRKITDTELIGDPIMIGLLSEDTWNVEIMRHLHKVKDLYSENNGKEVYVPTTYFQAGITPYEDAVHGPQYPQAGLSRGVIKGSLWINETPTSTEKQAYYDNHLNYIEADANGKYIMTQLTGTIKNTELKFVNKVRALLKMRKELTKKARLYIHEFNDDITITNLQNTLNASIANWIQNRTLSEAYVSITDYTTDSTLSNEEIAITLNVKFKNTIEVISITFNV